MNGHITENGTATAPVNSKREVSSEVDYRLKTFQTSLNLLVHILIGIVTGAALMFSFRAGVPTGATPIHVTLCVVGYQFLMAEAILSLSPHTGWTAHLRLVDKRRVHWILQILGSSLAIAGSFVKILDKTNHWETLHGQFALVALVFTTVSLVNGLASLWAFELKRFVLLPPKLSKLTHICFGIVGFTAASIALCYGFEKGAITSWTGTYTSYILISFTSCLTFIVIITPLFTFLTKIVKSN